MSILFSAVMMALALRKGTGEAGLAGAVGAILNAVNDALIPTGALLTEVPLTPPRILAAIDAEAKRL